MKRLFRTKGIALSVILFFLAFAIPAFGQYTNSSLESGGLYTAMAKDASNNVYVTKVLTGSGGATYEVVKYTNGTGTPTQIYTGLDHEFETYPWGLAVTSNGDVFITTSFLNDNSKIIKLTKSGATYTPSDFQTGRYFTGLAVDKNDNLYALEYSLANMDYGIVKYTDLATVNSTGTLIYHGIPTGTNISYPNSLAVSPTGDLFFNKSYSNDGSNIYKGGVVKLNFTAPSTYTPSDVSVDTYASSFTLDDFGNIYSVEGAGTGSTYKLTKYTNGAGTGTVIVPGLHATHPYYPWGVVFTGTTGFVADGDDGAGGSIIKLTPLDVLPPATPTNLAAAAGPGSNTLNWTANTDIDLLGYKIYGGTTANPTTLIASVQKGITTYTHTGLINGTVYYYRITAEDNAFNESGFSNEVNATPTPPSITSAAYNASTGALVVTGSSFVALTGAANDIVANKFTLTGEGGATYTLTTTPNVDITNSTTFTLTLSPADLIGVALILNKNGALSTNGTTYNLAAAEDWDAGENLASVIADLTGNAITVSSVPLPVITSVDYNASIGTLVATGTGFSRYNGATNDIISNKFTVTGEGGATYTLTNSANLEVTSNTAFTITLSATDLAAVNLIVNKNGASSTGGTTYNLAAADDWAAGADASLDISDLTSSVTASNVAVPTITTATYDVGTGILVVTGTGFKSLSGSNNDIDVAKLRLKGDAAALYVLTSANVDITSGTSFSVTVNNTDKVALGDRLNKDGVSSIDGTVYNLEAQEDWATGADATVVIADATNALTVSNAKLTQTISPIATVNKTYGDLDFQPGATATSALVVSYTSSDNTTALPYQDPADGNKWKIQILKAGSVTITAAQFGNLTYQAAPNVTFTLASAKADLTVKANDDSKGYTGVAYANNNGVTYTGFVKSETETVLGGTLAYTGTSQSAINVGNTYTIIPSGLTSTNYNLLFTNGTLSITPVALTVKANDDSKGYTGVAYASNNAVTYTGFVNNETVANLGGTLAYSGTSQSAINVGNAYTIIPSGLTASNYAIQFTNGTLSITPVVLSVKANDDSKGYTGIAYAGNSGVSYTGFVNNETAAILGGTLVYGGTSQGAINVGNAYTIIPSGLTSNNYTLQFTNGTLSIGKANLTVKANDDNKTYTGAGYTSNNGVSYTGFVNNETAANLGGALVYGGTSQGAVNIGTAYTIIPSGLTSSNYNIQFTNGNLSIGKAMLTVKANDDSRTYTGVTYASNNGVTYTGFVNNETASVLGGTLSYGGTSQVAINVGNTYTIIPSGLTSNNYTLQFANGTLSINKATLTVTANDDSKTYTGVAYASNNGVTYTGFINNETASVLSGTLAYSGTSQGAINVGNAYTIIPSGLTSNNYTLQFANGTLSINKATLTIKANDDSKTYTGVGYSAGNGVTYTGFVNNETAAILGGTLVYGGTSQGAINVGNAYTIIPSGLTSNNYTLQFTNGTLSIGKANLTVKANDDNKTYTGAGYTSNNGVSYTGFVNNETAANLGGALVYGGTSQGAVNIGTAYTIIPSGLTSSNYNIQFTNGNLSIGKAMLTVKANDDSRTYTGVTYASNNGVTYTGFVNNETASVLGGTLSYGGTSQVAINVGNTYTIIPSGLTSNNYTLQFANGTLSINKATLTVTANDDSKTYTGVAYASNNGVTYTGFINNETASVLSGTLAYSGTSQGAINVGNAYTIIPSGLTSNNYTLQFANGTLSINKATLTIKANDDSKTYTGVGYSAGNGVTYTGFINNETAAILGGTLVYGGTSQGAINVGNAYTIIPSGLTSNNYTLQFTNGTLNINKAVLNIVATAKSKTYGALEPALTYVATGLAGTDVITGNLNRVAGENVGTYLISQNTLTANANYTITFTGSSLQITPQALIITLDNKTKAYLAPNPVLTATYSGFVGAENASVFTTPLSISTTATTSSPAGNYQITGSGAAAANYIISYNAGTLTVFGNTQTINFAALANKLSTDASFSLTATASSGLAVSYSSSNTNIARIVNGNQVEIVGAGVVTITASQTGDSNYTAAIDVIQSLTIIDNPAPNITIVSSKGSSVSKGETAVLTASGATSYQWSNANGIIGGQNAAILTVRPNANTTYTVTGFNQYGRSSTRSFALEVRADFQVLNIMNVLTPNGDGKNDTWIIENIDMYPNNTVRVFDRAGKGVFEMKTYNNTWDGTYKGRVLPEGSYYYIIDFGPGIGIRKGYITIVGQQ